MSIIGHPAHDQVNSLMLRDVVAIGGEVRILNEVSLKVPTGEMHFLVGPTGAGKSTILRCIAGLDLISDGELEIEENVLTASDCGWRARSQELRRCVGMVFQDGRLLQRFTAFDNIALALRCSGIGDGEADERVRAVARQLDLEKLLPRRCDTLSGGQRQQVAIARALVLRPKVLLLDEITNGLDPLAIGRLSDLLLAVNATGVTMLLVSHQIRFAADHGRRIHFVSGGRILWSGPGADLLHAPAVQVAEFCNAVKKGW
jgi:ABC-type methionine transport system ATPase subunit